MENQANGPVTAKITDTESIEFASIDDALLFVAHTGDYRQYAQAYESLTGQKAQGKEYRARRSKDNQRRFWDMADRTRLTSGVTLTEALKRKVGKK